MLKPALVVLVMVQAAGSPEPARYSYVLGSEDQLSISALHAEEINGRVFSIDHAGFISVPLVGRLQAAGLTVEQLERELVTRLRAYIREPQVAIAITEFRSQPVSVLGAVASPGVRQLRGRRRLTEVLSMAGGVTSAAGPSVTVVRRREYGPIPVPSATEDPDGKSWVATLPLRALREADSDIWIQPHDTVEVPRAQVVYVLGEVARPGSFPLSEAESLSAMQAVSLAGGVNRTGSPDKARILRPILGTSRRAELPVNLKTILSGRSPDMPLLANDILFVPGSGKRRISARAAEALIQAGTWALTWGAVR